MSDDERPDFDALAVKIVEWLRQLLDESNVGSEELADLVARVVAAVESDDARGQVELLPVVDDWLEGERELREEIRNAFALFHLYVHLKNGGGLRKNGVPSVAR